MKHPDVGIEDTLRELVSIHSSRTVSVDELHSGTSLIHDLSYSSVELITLVTKIEEALSFEFADDMLTMETFADLETLTRSVRSMLHH